MRTKAIDTLIRYGSAILAVLAATLLRNVLHAMGDSGISPIYFAAIIFSAWYGGFGPGVLATGLSGLATAYLLMPHANTVQGVRDAVLRVLVFMVVAILTSSLNAALKRASDAITDNAIIPLKERVVDRFYDPLARLLGLFRR